MTVKSMTGFARIAGQSEAFSWVWEARSVNGRGLELRVRLPDAADSLEALIRKKAKTMLSRGNVTIGLRVSRERDGASHTAPSDQSLADVIAQLLRIESAAQNAGLDLRAGSAVDILSLPALTNGASGDDPGIWIEAAKAGIDPLLEALLSARTAEGAALSDVLTITLDELETLIAIATRQANARTDTLRKTLRAKVETLLTDTDTLDPGRLEQEMALLLVKSDVTEEIDRLRAHVTAAQTLLRAQGPIGRKFDFLMQEFNREANTLCSKSGDVDLTQTGLDMKVLIDRMREQSQNIE